MPNGEGKSCPAPPHRSVPYRTRHFLESQASTFLLLLDSMCCRHFSLATCTRQAHQRYTWPLIASTAVYRNRSARQVVTPTQASPKQGTHTICDPMAECSVLGLRVQWPEAEDGARPVGPDPRPPGMAGTWFTFSVQHGIGLAILNCSINC